MINQLILIIRDHSQDCVDIHLVDAHYSYFTRAYEKNILYIHKYTLISPLMNEMMIALSQVFSKINVCVQLNSDRCCDDNRMNTYEVILTYLYLSKHIFCLAKNHEITSLRTNGLA